MDLNKIHLQRTFSFNEFYNYSHYFLNNKDTKEISQSFFTFIYFYSYIQSKKLFKKVNLSKSKN